MSKKESLIKNYSYSLIYKMLDILAPLVTAPYLARVLGPNGVGTYSYTNSVASFFVLFASAGINIYGQREIAYIQHDREKYTGLFNEIFFLKTALTLVTGAIYCAVTFCNSIYGALYRVLLITVLANGLDISWFFQGMENFKIIAVRNSIIRLLGIVLIFAFVKSQDDLLLYTLLCSLPILIGNLSLWTQLRTYLGHWKIDRSHLRKHIRPIISLFIPQIAVEIYTVLDKTMLGKLGASMVEVAYYEQSQKMVKLGLRFVTAFGAIMMSRVSNAYAEKGIEGVKENIGLSFRFTFFLATPIMFGVAAIALRLVPWFYGTGYEKVAPLIMMAAPIVMLIGISNIIGTQVLIPTKHQKQYTITIVAGAVINFIFNLGLIPFLASVGATVASVLAETSVTILQIVLLRKIMPVGLYFKSGGKCFFSGIIMFGVVFAIGFLFEAGALCTVVQIIAGALVYIALLAVLRESFFAELLTRRTNNSVK